MRHTGARPAVTIHAYSPPLWRMGAYEVLPGGELRRHSLSYAEELRPLGNLNICWVVLPKLGRILGSSSEPLR